MSTAIPPKQQNSTTSPANTALRPAASLPQLAKKDDSKRVQEIYDSILWRIEAKCTNNETLAVGVTGCVKKSGVTTIAANLAMRASQQQAGRVLLIDANWQPPGLLKTFNLEPVPGLYDILSGEIAPRECEPQPATEHLDVLCRGQWEEDQPTQLRQELAAEMLADFKTEYCLILVDLPAVQELRSALPLARQLDGTLLAARFEAVKQTEAQRALQRLQEDGVTVWGSILNRHREYVPNWARNLV